jgi:hypothetical protein
MARRDVEVHWGRLTEEGKETLKTGLREEYSDTFAQVILGNNNRR